MLLCDVASPMRLSIRFRGRPSCLGNPNRVKLLRQWRLDYNIAPRVTSTEAETGETGTRGRGDTGTGMRRRGDGDAGTRGRGEAGP